MLSNTPLLTQLSALSRLSEKIAISGFPGFPALSPFLFQKILLGDPVWVSKGYRAHVVNGRLCVSACADKQRKREKVIEASAFIIAASISGRLNWR